MFVRNLAKPLLEDTLVNLLDVIPLRVEMASGGEIPT
jgi:hypothetical protein